MTLGIGQRLASERILQRMRTQATLLAGAMIVGVLLFAGIVAFVSTLDSKVAAELPVSTTTAGIGASLLSLVLVPISYLLRRRNVAASLASVDPIARGRGFIGANLVALALCEGAALLPVALALVTRDLLSFAPAFAIAFLGLLVQVPTPSAFDRHVAEPASGRGFAE